MNRATAVPGDTEAAASERAPGTGVPAERCVASTVGALEERWFVRREASGGREYDEEVLAETHLPWRLERYETDLPGEVTVRRLNLGSVRVVDCAADPCGGRRGSTQLASTEDEWIAVMMADAGTQLFEQGSTNIRVGGGGAFIWHSTGPARFRIAVSMRKRTVFAPRSLVAAVAPKVGHLDAIVPPTADPNLTLLRSFAAEAVRNAPILDLDAQQVAGRLMIELLAAVLRRQKVDATEFHEPLFVRAKEYIGHHLADPDLRPLALAMAIGISVRTLHQVFAKHEETVSGYIRRQRLSRCREQLERGEATTVTEVSFRWGFSNAAHFSRIFKAQFGISPSEILAAARATTSVG